MSILCNHAVMVLHMQIEIALLLTFIPPQVINKPKEKKEKKEAPPEKPVDLGEFIDQNETKMKNFGMLQDYDARLDDDFKVVPFMKLLFLLRNDKST